MPTKHEMMEAKKSMRIKKKENKDRNKVSNKLKQEKLE